MTITDGVSVCYDTMTVFVNAPVHAFSSDTITYCGVDTATLDAGTGWSNYAWSTGDSTQLFTTTKGGVYHLTVTNQYGCTISDSVSVGVINTTLEQGDTTICVGETATLTVSPNGVSTEHALAFDGNGDFVISPYNASFNVSSVTIEAWVYSSNFSQNGFIFEKGAVNTQYSLFFEGGTLKFRNGGATFAINSASAGFTNNAWHHVAFSFNSGVTNGTNIYIDGILKLTTTYSISSQSVAVAIGSGFGLRYDFDFFVFRFDTGFKTYNPALPLDQRWWTEYKFQNAVFNIGINYPF